MAENLELEKTLKVDGQEYNINAVQADKVANKLTLKPMNLDGTVSAEGSGKWTIFDGSSAQSLNIVPAAGGQFEGKIRVPDLATAVNDKDVLNYKDIVSKVVDRLLNTSAMATWTGNELSFTDTETPAVHGICVVLGNESDVASFANQNHISKWIPNYLYICKDTGNIFLGKAESTEINLLSGITKDKTITPRNIEVAAGQWITNNAYGLDMANSDVINLNGLFFADYANQYNEGINFIRTYDEEATNSDIKDPEKAAELVVDRVYARDGKLCFEPNRKVNEDLLENPFEVYHSGIDKTPALGANYVINQHITDYEDDTPADETKIVFKYASPTTEKGALYTRKLSNLWAYLVAKIRNAFGFNNNNVLTVANGGTGQTNLTNVVVGRANTSDNIKVWKLSSVDKYNDINAWSIFNNGVSCITVCSDAPKDTYGNNGDIWIKI
jgi:hypothetical protein